ncbi:MAG: enhancer of mRNA decapping [Icmadophila ericetorum]|nr:enhancer of mRNA decapping [Icmadophila ericetorum]
MAAADFIGSTILVKLIDPPNGQVRGVVAGIVGQQVQLQNVLWVPTNEHLSIYAIEGENIADLEVLPEEPPPSFIIVSDDQPAVSAQTSGLEEQQNISTDYPERGGLQEASNEPREVVPAPRSAVSAISATSISDPSIISIRRPASKTRGQENTSRSIASTSRVPSLMVSGTLGDDVKVTLSPTYSKRTPTFPLGEIEGFTKEENVSRKEALATATLLEPFDNLTLSTSFQDVEEAKTLDLGGLGIEHVEEPEPTKRNGKRARRARVGRFTNRVAQSLTPALVENQDLSPIANRSQKRTPASKRRRQQSIAEARSVEDSPTLPKRAVNGRGKVPGRRQSRHDRLRVNDANGWATEDATDIQEMGDFDFEANLSKFDKHKVFTQFRTDDTTADEARLVSHNRLPPKPGTAGGKNLHFTENVLSAKANGFAKWTSEAGESENEDVSEARISSGRSSRRNTSRLAMKKPPSRKGSAITPQEPFRISTTSIGSLRYSSFEHMGSPKPKQILSTSHTGSASNPKHSLRIIPSNKLCPCLTPLQLIEIEQIAISDLGVTEEMITENAARGIAETAVRAIRSIDSDNENRKNVPELLISLLVGNHKTGARTLAAARHLRNHGYRVNACILGGEREENLLDIVQQQAYAFSKSGGTILVPNLFLDGLKGGQIAPSLVIEAMLGVHATFEELRRDDQGICYEILNWVNRNELDVLCIDVPSGTNPSTGEVTQVNSKPLSLIPDTVLSLGAPKPWLLAFLADNSSRDDVEIFLADIAISKLAWKRLGNRRNRGIDFAGEWLVKLRYQVGSE